jgi:hypothetical protein
VSKRLNREVLAWNVVSFGVKSSLRGAHPARSKAGWGENTGILPSGDGSA